MWDDAAAPVPETATVEIPEVAFVVKLTVPEDVVVPTGVNETGIACDSLIGIVSGKILGLTANPVAFTEAELTVIDALPVL